MSWPDTKVIRGAVELAFITIGRAFLLSVISEYIFRTNLPMAKLRIVLELYHASNRLKT